MKLKYYRNADDSLHRITGFQDSEVYFGYDSGGVFTVIAYHTDGRTEKHTGDYASKIVENINNSPIGCFAPSELASKIKEAVQWLNFNKSK